MKKKLILLSSVVLIVVLGLVTWKIQEIRAKSEKRESKIIKSVSSEEIVEMLKAGSLLAPEKTAGIVATAESRKEFLKTLREYFALAARSRREGLADTSDYELALQLKENAYLADAYALKLSAGNPDFKRLTKEDLNAYLADGNNDNQNKLEIDAIYAIQKTNMESMESPQAVTPKPSGETLEKVRQQWAWSRIYSDKARADEEFMQQTGNQLRLKIIDASILSAGLLAKYWKSNIKPTNQDIAAFLSTHPEFEVRKKLELAKTILNRAKSGEDFAKLAQEYSEDRSTKDQGGLYNSQIKNGGIWKEVEAAVLQLEKGQIADRIIESKDGYHIVQLVDKRVTKGKDGSETISYDFRHILLQRKFEDPTVDKTKTQIPPPFMLPEEIAKAAVEKDKRQKFVEEIVRKENISLPEDFNFELPKDVK